jgi:predicted nuclease of predicted toxin-antitoxin system
MKILVDMNLSPRWVERLTNADIHALHWSAAGRHDAADTELMQFAAGHNFIVLTHDLDFGAILAATHGLKPSVVQIRSDDLNPDKIGHHVILALQKMSDELAQGALITVEPQRTRLRWLPLRPAS